VNRWPLLRLLLTTHLPFLVLLWPVYLVLVGLVITGFATFGSVPVSFLDVGSQILRWLAVGFGIHLTYEMLPIYLVHGQTRREFAAQMPVFLIVASAVLAALLCLSYAGETLLYNANGWPQKVADERLYGAADEYPLIFLSYWAMLLVWSVVGTLIGAGFYRFSVGGLLTVPVGLVLVAVAGFGIGFNELPWVDVSFGVDNVSLPATAALCGACVVAGVALMWAVVRDMPLRNQTG
jgi:hypothetical protein